MEKIKRDTNTDLFRAALKEAREAGQLTKMDAITDYALSEDYYVTPITNYEFDTWFVVNYGSCEGIYIDAYIQGGYDENLPFDRKRRHSIGTIKTLNTDLESMQIMAEACGTLTHFAHQYVTRNLDRYTPEAERKRRAEREAAAK